ncbi:MAG: LysR family transcriptional regulator [Burkholderiaceae bacterium]|nr:LysR family transcriptional regulator [Burkholderiaceae bacterium]
MDSKSIELFLRVVEFGSINKAAGDLNISQPSLSRIISSLEHEMGTSLFTRTQGGVQLTDAGRLLSDRARPLLSQFALLKEQLGETSGQVALGIPPSWQEVFTSKLIKRILIDSPGVTLRIHEGVSHVLREYLTAGLLDICIVPFSSIPLSGYTQTNLVREPLILVGHKSEQLVPTEPVALAKLNGIKLVLPGKPNAIRQLIEHSLQRQSLKFKLAMQVDTLALCMNVASQNLAYTVVPACAVVNIKDDHEISWSPIKGLYMTWALFENESRSHSPAVKECKRALLETVHSSLSSGKWIGAEAISRTQRNNAQA